MRRDEAINLLRLHRTELHRLGVGRLYLYGSVARDCADDDSDVDLLIEPDSDRFSLFDMMRVQDEAARILGRPAELHDYRGLERAPDFKARISGDLVNVF
jgi:predicted nucleotidyltransferase